MLHAVLLSELPRCGEMRIRRDHQSFGTYVVFSWGFLLTWWGDLSVALYWVAHHGGGGIYPLPLTGWRTGYLAFEFTSRVWLFLCSPAVKSAVPRRRIPIAAGLWSCFPFLLRLVFVWGFCASPDPRKSW